jgi:hypothetical protein
MSAVRPALESAGFDVAPTSYGIYGVSHFLLRSDNLRRKAIDRVARDIRTARTAHNQRRGLYPRRMSVISHSFGTYVISQILDDCRDLKWYRIIFCGSVVREDYRLDKVQDQFTPKLLNEVGTRDFLPVCAESAGWDYGAIGSHGLNHPLADTRWHNGFKHSSFLTKQFCEKFWIPFLQGRELIAGDEVLKLPWCIRVLSALPPSRGIVLPIVSSWVSCGRLLAPLFWIAILLGVGWLFWSCWSLLRSFL